MSFKPSLDLLRSITDEHVLRVLMRSGRATRAQVAAETGISKPTISESVRRLVEAGLLVDTGERTTGRGGVGSYFTLADDIGVAMVIAIAPTGVRGELVDAFGSVVAETSAPVGRPAVESGVAEAVVQAGRDLAAENVRIAVVSAADPVDRRTGGLVHLPDAPFLVGTLDPVTLLQPFVDGQVFVDNDVNWSARTEHESGCAQGIRDFVYLHLGEGLGFAVVSDGEVRRGHRGVAGEIAHVYTTGPDGTAMPLTEVFEVLGLHRPGTAAIDVDALRATSQDVQNVIVRAVSGALTAAVSIVDPEIAVIGGEWGPGLASDIDAAMARTPRPVTVTSAQVTDPAMTGARSHAIERLRSAIVTARTDP